MKFIMFLKRTLLILCIIFITNNTNAQEYKDKVFDEEEVINSPMANINSSSPGLRFQDIKRGVLQFWTNNEMGEYFKSTGLLINTVNNTYDNNNQKVYILVGSHYIKPSVGKNIDIWLSFDYELPDENTSDEHRIDAENELHIQRLYKTPVKTVVSDVDADVCLLEADFSDVPLSIHKAFVNSFAAGWNLHPDYVNKGFNIISHPGSGPKKKLHDYSGHITVSNGRRDGWGKRHKQIGLTHYDWPNQQGKVIDGSCGTSLLDNKGLSFAVTEHPGLNTVWFSLLENVWMNNYDNAGANTLGLMHYLDPGNTWISSVPGGYLKDLIQYPSVVDYDLEVNNTPKTKEINMNSMDFFNFPDFGRTAKEVLADGILPTTPNTGEIIMYLTPTSNPNYLLYGVTYEDDMSFYESIFKSNSWVSGENPFNIDNFPTNNNGISDDLKQGLLSHFCSIHGSTVNFEGFRDFNFNANIHLQAKSGTTAKVRAIKLPDMMPYNAVELFEPARLAN
ncbi:MAG: hypothetical protein V4722_27650, partial [Bacteroidota bacterium]